MAWLAVDMDGTECIFEEKPYRRAESWDADKGWSEFYRGYSVLPHSSIKKLIGRELSFDDEPVELT